MQFNNFDKSGDGLADILPQTGQNRNLQIANAFAAIHSIWWRQADLKRTKFITRIDDKLPKSVEINGLKVQHCLNNLVSNAVQHTKDGQIILSALQISSKNGDFLVLSVSDSGPGIAPEHMDLLFKHIIAPKQKTYGQVETGLPMTNELIKELGGRIIVKSKLGKGSVFALVFPLKTGQIIKTEKPVNTGFAHLNILVVDDYTLNQLTIKTMLGNHKGRIYSATHGYEALDILAEHEVDLVLMDIHMPVLDGIETTMRIRDKNEKWANVPIYAMTADPQYQHADLCCKIGMNGAFAKPLRYKTLISILKKIATSQNMAQKTDHDMIRAI